MNSWIASHALPLVLPLILGPLAKWGTDGLKGGITDLDKAPAAVKQGVAIGLAFLLAGAAHFVGNLLPANCGSASPDVQMCLQSLTDPSAMQVLLGGLVAIALKHGQQQQAS